MSLFSCHFVIFFMSQGLLQSEVEGVDNENVGFYGRCVLHATYSTNNTSSDATCPGKEYSGQREESCARTEVLCDVH